jgi:hypothetical protein
MKGCDEYDLLSRQVIKRKGVIACSLHEKLVMGYGGVAQ